MNSSRKQRLRTMLAMARHGWKVSEIAHQLGVTKQMVSLDVQLLEYLLGDQLFGRNNPGKPRITIASDLAISNRNPHTCECGDKLGVVDSRARGTLIYRRRKCKTCGDRITTVEVAVIT